MTTIVTPAATSPERVYYQENGPEDTGTIVGICRTRKGVIVGYVVVWDNGDEKDEYTPDQLVFIEE